MVDEAAGSGGFGSVVQSLQLEQTGTYTYALHLGQKTLPVELAPLNAAAKAVQGNELVLISRGVRLFSHWAAAAQRWYGDRQTQRREKDFYQNAGLI